MSANKFLNSSTLGNAFPFEKLTPWTEPTPDRTEWEQETREELVSSLIVTSRCRVRRDQHLTILLKRGAMTARQRTSAQSCAKAIAF